MQGSSVDCSDFSCIDLIGRNGKLLIVEVFPLQSASSCPHTLLS